MQKNLSLKLYPNPAGEWVMVDLNQNPGETVEVYNLTGSRVFATPYRKNLTIDVSGLTEGLYVVKVSGDGFYLHEKLVIR
jgi:hypothetical protein